MISRDILEEKIRELELLAIEIETKGVKLFQDSPIIVFNATFLS